MRLNFLIGNSILLIIFPQHRKKTRVLFPQKIIHKTVVVNMQKLFTKNFIPLLISILLIIISIGFTIFDKYALNYKHYLGILLILISTIIFFNNKKAYIIIFLSTLFLGLFGLLDIFYTSFLFGIGDFQINPIFLILIVLFIWLSKDELNEIFPDKERSE